MKHRTESSRFNQTMASSALSMKKAGPNPFRSQNRAETERGNEIWLLTLSDLLMLLMIFFVVLFGMALQREKKTNITASPSEHASVVPSPASKKEDSSASIEKDLIAALNCERDQKDVSIERFADLVILTFPERIVFDPGQAQLKSSAQATLDKVAAFISERSHLVVEVQGHTDDRPIHSPRYPSNWELSLDRAMQVSRVLIGLGVNPTQLSVKGFGEYRPHAPNDSDTNRLINRRVEIQFSVSPTL